MKLLTIVDKASIISFGNCKLVYANDIDDIEKEENKEGVMKYGTCYCLIKPKSEWVNPVCAESVEGMCFAEKSILPSGGVAAELSHSSTHHRTMQWSTKDGKKEGLTLLSTLLCTRGGIITIETSGQTLFNISYADVQKKIVIDEWLTLYTYPTVDCDGRHVPRHINAAVYDWGMQEEINNNSRGSDWFEKDSPASKEIANANGTMTVQLTPNNLYTDQDGRYWVAVGPNVMNPNHTQARVQIDASEMNYGTKLDIVVKDKDGTLYCIPAVVGDAKEHSYPDGLYQTGVPFDKSRPEGPKDDNNTVEFIGYDVIQKVYQDGEQKSSVNITNNYELVEIIVYDGIINYY